MAAEQLEHFLEPLGHREQMIGQDLQEVGALDEAELLGLAQELPEARLMAVRDTVVRRTAVALSRSRLASRSVRSGAARPFFSAIGGSGGLRTSCASTRESWESWLAPLGELLGQTWEKRLDLPHLLLAIESPRHDPLDL